MTANPAALFDRFRLASNEALLGCTPPGGEGRQLACDVVERLSKVDAADARRAPRRIADAHEFPALQHWREAIDNGLTGQPLVEPLCDALADLYAVLPWYRRPEPALPDFMAGHANAVLIGPGGWIGSARLLIGVTVMAPDTVYPDHHHPPAEGYVVLSEGQWRQEQDAWKSPGVGGWVYNPPDIVHAMRSGLQPLLAVWYLPLD